LEESLVAACSHWRRWPCSLHAVGPIRWTTTMKVSRHPPPQDGAGDLTPKKTTANAAPALTGSIVPASHPLHPRQQRESDVDYNLQPSPSAAANGTSGMPAGAAAYVSRTTTPNKKVTTDSNMVAISPITPRGRWTVTTWTGIPLRILTTMRKRARI
jgi:hypothetical protein